MGSTLQLNNQGLGRNSLGVGVTVVFSLRQINGWGTQRSEKLRHTGKLNAMGCEGKQTGKTRMTVLPFQTWSNRERG